MLLAFDKCTKHPMVDEILDKLDKIGDLKVIARTSSERFKNTNL
jgi:TolB-like protein